MFVFSSVGKSNTGEDERSQPMGSSQQVLGLFCPWDFGAVIYSVPPVNEPAARLQDSDVWDWVKRLQKGFVHSRAVALPVMNGQWKGSDAPSLLQHPYKEPVDSWAAQHSCSDNLAWWVST